MMYRRLMRKPSKFNIMESRDTSRGSTGSITLEATIFLTLFILFYMILMSLVQIAKAQVILQYSINEVAKEVSAYSYVLTKTGIVQKRVQTAGQRDEFAGKTTELFNALDELGNTLSEGGDVVNAAQGVGNAANNTIGYIQGYVDDPDSLLNDLIALVKAEGADILSEAVIQQIVLKEVEKQISVMSNKDADQYLEDLGIEEGIEGLSFEGTSWANASNGGMPVLEVVLVYSIEFKFGFFELEPRTYRLSAKTALW